MKALLYCPKGKPYLVYGCTNKYIMSYSYDTTYSKEVKNNLDCFNGTIPCECDYEIEEIYYGCDIDDFWTKTCGSQSKHNLLAQSCLTDDEMHQYLQPRDSYYGNCGYAVHIKGLKVFDEPKHPYDSVHQNMRYMYDEQGNKCVLISIKPELMCKVLNGECTIIIKKKVLKEML